MFNGLVAAVGIVFGMLVLVVFSGLPLWLFSGVVTLIYSLVTPLTSVAQGLLYGDAVAEHDGAEQPALIDAG